MKALIILALLCAFFVQPTFAATIQDWSINVEINEDRTSEWTVSILYNETVQKSDYFILAEVSSVETKIDGVAYSCDLTKQALGTLIECKKAGKIYYFDPNNLNIEGGTNVIVETARAIEFGNIVVSNIEVPENEIVSPLKKVIRIATAEDEKVFQENKKNEKK